MKQFVITLSLAVGLMACNKENNSPKYDGVVLGKYTEDACNGNPWLVAYESDTIIVTNLPTAYQVEATLITFKIRKPASLQFCTTCDTNRPKVYSIGSVALRE